MMQRAKSRLAVGWLLGCLLMPSVCLAELDKVILPASLLQTSVLPVDQAFRPGLRREGDTRTVFWQITPGYYLFRHKMSVREDGEPLALELPPGRAKVDKALGEVEVYDGYVELALPPGEGRLTLRYQGCAEAGYCYPPVERSLGALSAID